MGLWRIRHFVNCHNVTLVPPERNPGNQSQCPAFGRKPAIDSLYNGTAVADGICRYDMPHDDTENQLRASARQAESQAHRQSAAILRGRPFQTRHGRFRRGDRTSSGAQRRRHRRQLLRGERRRNAAQAHRAVLRQGEGVLGERPSGRTRARRHRRVAGARRSGGVLAGHPQDAAGTADAVSFLPARHRSRAGRAGLPSGQLRLPAQVGLRRRQGQPEATVTTP